MEDRGVSVGDRKPSDDIESDANGRDGKSSCFSTHMIHTINNLKYSQNNMLI